MVPRFPGRGRANPGPERNPEEETVATVVNKIRRWLRSPQGRQARAHAERLARDPRTRNRVRRMFRGRRRY